jgi:transcription initiation factor IIE alpha subunit
MTIRTQLTEAIDDVCNRFSPIVCNFLDDRWLVVMALMEAPDLKDEELAAKVGLSQSQVKKIFREVGFGSGG